MRSPKHLVLAILIGSLGVIGLATCGERDRIVTVEGVTYYFPAGVLDGFLPAEHNGRGKPFIRLHPSPVRYVLVYDPLTQDLPNKQGPDVPTISGINFSPVANVDVFLTNAGPVVCVRTETELHFTCGMRVQDAHLSWAVKFDRHVLGSAEAIKRSAEKTLLAYRTEGRAKQE